MREEEEGEEEEIVEVGESEEVHGVCLGWEVGMSESE